MLFEHSFLHKTPKVELHSHLHGSIPFDILETIIKKQKYVDPAINTKLENLRFNLGNQKLSQCFDYFSIVHSIVNDVETIAYITDVMIDNFAAENVVYLEIRTTPRDCVETGLTVHKYMETVTNRIIAGQTRHPNLIVKLILSVNRVLFEESKSDTLESHLKSLSCFAKQYPDLVVGLDVSGDPTKGNMEIGLNSLKTWLRDPLTRDMYLSRLGVSIHAGEIKNDEEVEQILNFKPERIGHGCFMSACQIQRIVEQEEPHVEFCPTSNHITTQLSFMEDHHFRLWRFYGRQSLLKKKMRAHKDVDDYKALNSDICDDGVNYSISTDDCGLFATSNAQECLKFGEAFRLDPRAIWSIHRRAVRASFAPQEIKDKLLTDVFSEVSFNAIMKETGMEDAMKCAFIFGSNEGEEDIPVTDDAMDSDEGQ